MANVGGVRPSWIAKLREQRPEDEVKQPGAAKARGESAVPRSGSGVEKRPQVNLESAYVPEKLAKEHGKHLEGALAEIAQLAKLGDRMESWRKKQLERALGQFYKVLGVQLSLAPAEARDAIAKRTIAALLELATANGTNDHLMPAIFASLGLVDSGVRLVAQKKLALSTEEAASVGEEAARAVKSLAAAIAGRSGAASALNIYANLVEQLERATPALTETKRIALWENVARFIAASMPRRGFNQAAAAQIVDRVQRELAGGAKPDVALARAREAGEAEARPLADQALAQIRAGAEVFAAGTPQRQCLDHVVGALEGVLKANPLGPAALVQAVEAFRASAQQTLQNVRNQDVYQIWGCGAALIAKVAEQPIALETISFLTTLLPQLSGRPMSVAGLQRAVDAADLIGASFGLVDAQLGLWNRSIAQTPNFDPALQRLHELDAATALQVAMAMAPQLANAQQSPSLATGLIELAKTARADEPFAFLQGYANRYAMLANRIQAWLGANDKVPAIAARIARATAGDNLPQNVADLVGQMLRSVQWTMQRVDVLDLLSRDATGRPGIIELSDPALRWRYPPTTFFESLLNQVRGGLAQHDGPKQAEATRLALAMSAKLGNLDGEWAVPFNGRILPDWGQAMLNPAQLHYAARAQGGVGVRAQQGTVASFLEAHPELPLELAFSAGLHLTPEQLAWACERAGEAKGRDTVRSLRDFIFASITANRKDLIDTVRASKSPAKAISAAITEIGREYRANRLNTIPWDEISAGLAAGGDPLAELQKRRVDAGLVGLNLNELAGGKPNPDGMEMIAKCAPAITSCLTYYEQQKALFPNTDAQIDYGLLIQPFMEVLKSVATGTWPKVKYENEVGKRLLAQLTPAQQEVWRQEMITPLAGGAAIGVDPALANAITMMKGLEKALPLEVRLTQEFGALDWDAGSADKLSKQRAVLLEELHQLDKGSERHRELGYRLGLLNRNLAVIELQLALKTRFAAGAKPDAKSVLLELRPYLQNAASALRAFGAAGASTAVTEALFVAQDIKSSPRQGRYAVDEDSLESLIMSHTTASGSCLNYVSGFRRWGLAGSAADANIRMLRSYDGDRFGYRAFLKLFGVELEGYKGPALWIDSPMREGNGQPEDLQLLYRNAIRKAAAMGIPVMGPDANLTREGQQQGLQTKAAMVKFFVDEGNTGAQHSDFLFGGAGNVRKNRGQNPFWEVQKNAQIVLPPGK